MGTVKKLFIYMLIFHALKKNIKSGARLASSVSILFIIQFLYLAFFRSKAKLYYTKNKQNLKILSKCPSIEDRYFRPAPLFPNCLL